MIAALCWLLPWLGAVIALMALALADLPALVLNWPNSLIPLAMAALFTVLVFAILETCVEPRLFNRRRYNSLFIVLAVIALAETFGILGLLLGPMVAVAIQAALEHLERERIAAQRPAADLAGLEARIAELRSRAAFREDTSPRMDESCGTAGGPDCQAQNISTTPQRDALDPSA